MNTNRKSEIDDSVPNSGLQPPSATQHQPPAGLCLLLLFVLASRKEFLSKEFRSLSGEERAGTLGDFYVWQRCIESFQICISDLFVSWRSAASPNRLFPSPFCSSLSVLLHHNLIFRLLPFLFCSCSNSFFRAWYCHISLSYKEAHRALPQLPLPWCPA